MKSYGQLSLIGATLCTDFDSLTDTQLKVLMASLGRPVPPGLPFFRTTVVAFLRAFNYKMNGGSV
jgi:hypothetical protein